MTAIGEGAFADIPKRPAALAFTMIDKRHARTTGVVFSRAYGSDRFAINRITLTRLTLALDVASMQVLFFLGRLRSRDTSGFIGLNEIMKLGTAKHPTMYLVMGKPDFPCYGAKGQAAAEHPGDILFFLVIPCRTPGNRGKSDLPQLRITVDDGNNRRPVTAHFFADLCGALARAKQVRDMGAHFFSPLHAATLAFAGLNSAHSAFVAMLFFN
jgi:hypothetical protein